MTNDGSDAYSKLTSVESKLRIKVSMWKWIIKKSLLLSAIVLFSSNALAKWSWTGFDKQEIVNEIPVLFEKTLNQYPELKGTFESDIESIQLSLNVPLYLLLLANVGLRKVRHIFMYTLEMDVTDIESENTMKLECQVRVESKFNGFFSMKFFDRSWTDPKPPPPCNLTHQDEDEKDDGTPIFTNPDLNLYHEFQV